MASWDVDRAECLIAADECPCAVEGPREGGGDVDRTDAQSACSLPTSAPVPWRDPEGGASP
jgi:hypothetical protein